VATIAIRRLRNAIRRDRTAKRGGGRVGQLDAPPIDQASVVALLDLIAGDVETPSRTAAHHEAIDAVQEALRGLPDDYRRAVQLVYIEGASVADAAAMMGRSDRAIHNLCYKAKDHLRGLLGSGSRFLSGS
jgi:RNA polymerase sigma factor (sigma-70 family)